MQSALKATESQVVWHTIYLNDRWLSEQQCAVGIVLVVRQPFVLLIHLSSVPQASPMQLQTLASAFATISTVTGALVACCVRAVLQEPCLSAHLPRLSQHRPFDPLKAKQKEPPALPPPLQFRPGHGLQAVDR